MDPQKPVFVHPTAIVEDHVVLGDGTAVWDHAHIRRGARIGRSTIVGGKATIAPGVVVGDFVKINTGVYLCRGVTVEDFCMLAAHCVFTNDRFPRAGNRALTGLETSEPTDHTLATVVRRGATIGANATLGPGLTIGAFAMVGMGAVVTRDVPPYALVLGNPARLRGFVCACGPVLARTPVEGVGARLECADCGRGYRLEADALVPLE